MRFEPGSGVLMRPVVGCSYFHSNNLIGESYLEQVRLENKKSTQNTGGRKTLIALRLLYSRWKNKRSKLNRKQFKWLD